MRCTAFGDDRSDPAGVEKLPVRLGVVAAVGEENVRSAPWSAALSAQGRDRLDERDELGDVVAVGGGKQAGERDAVCIRDQVMLAPSPIAVDRAGASFAAPKSARNEAESQTARERSSWSRWRSLARSNSCRRSKTPA